jgi:hypothetical protein
MPFVPLDPKDKAKYTGCKDPQHNPPSHIVIREPVKWVCPSCGHSVVIYPAMYSLCAR